MAVGSAITSVYAGPADPVAFGLAYPVPEEKTHKIKHSEKLLKLFSLYQQVRDIREKKSGHEPLQAVFDELVKNYPDDWLLPLEIMEISDTTGEKNLYERIREYLQKKSEENQQLAKLIQDGFAALNEAENEMVYSTTS
ncbi:MAG: hypothetical protein ACM3N9_02005, partial [Syntrophothermus sp.]